MSVFGTILLIFAASQVYWAWRGYRFAAARIRSRAVLWLVCGAVLAAYLVLYEFNMGDWRDRATPVQLTIHDAFLSAPFLCWAASSLFAFFVAVLFAIPQGIAWLWRKFEKPMVPARREFLGRTAAVAAAAPFVAGAYGLLYGRLNLEVTHPTVRIPRLPRAFDGFRICQLSDIHIGPFMPESEIRKYAAIANAEKADLVALTGDFVTFDAHTQGPVVEALRGLRAPFGVFGCLGNHDAWAGVEDSITELFRQIGVRILRGESVAIRAGAEWFNLLGGAAAGKYRGAHRPPAPQYSAQPQSGHLRPGGGIGDRPQPGGPYPRRAGGAGIHQPGDRAQPAHHSLRGRMVP